MKIQKTAAGKKLLTMSREEWQAIGEERGWLEKEAKWDTDHEVPESEKGKWTNYTIAELKKKLNAAKDKNKKLQDAGKKADPKTTEKIRELQYAIRAKTQASFQRSGVMAVLKRASG